MSCEEKGGGGSSVQTGLQCLVQRPVSRVIHPVGLRLDPVENIVPGHL